MNLLLYVVFPFLPCRAWVSRQSPTPFPEQRLTLEQLENRGPLAGGAPRLRALGFEHVHVSAVDAAGAIPSSHHVAAAGGALDGLCYPSARLQYEFGLLNATVTGVSQAGSVGLMRPVQLAGTSWWRIPTLTGNRTTWTYRGERSGNGTELSLEVEYEVPPNQVTRFASARVLRTMNENTAREIVNNVKALAES